ncbi:MAG: hypothetical protein PVJ50_00970 [Desulfobacterales bacterium]
MVIFYLVMTRFPLLVSEGKKRTVITLQVCTSPLKRDVCAKISIKGTA